MSATVAWHEGRPMSAGESVTRWIDQLKEGDREAAERLWERYFARLVRLARGWLQHTPRQAADEEDVALGAFASFCRRAEEGRFPRLSDRDDLWQLLVVIAYRKSCNQIAHEGRRRPAGGTVQHASACEGAEGALFADVIGRGPSPELAAQTAEECRRRLAALDDEVLRRVAVWKMEGHTNEEIAAKLGRSLPTVERKLALIRGRWLQELTP
jgi:DNA-directed RNA polymerase specialized sigma24 family protein